MSVADRIENKIERITESGCWIWTGSLTNNGYGRVSVSRKIVVAHKISYLIYRGDIPKGLTLDHLCRVRCCVNPWHLEPVTMRENIMRGESFASKNAKKEFCPAGHQYSGENLAIQVSGGRKGRYCRECARRKSKIYTQKIANGRDPAYILNAKKTHCPKGHPYSGSNLEVREYKGRTRRLCLECRRQHNKNIHAKRKGAVCSGQS